jgi:Zn-dependent protease with chaperone function
MASSVISRKQLRLRDYRYPGEVTSLVLTFIILVTLYALAIWLFPSSARQVMQALAITAVGLTVYVITIIVQQRSVFGTLVRVSPRQFPELYQVSTAAAENLASSPVPVYVKRSSEQNIYTLGFWGNPLIVITSSMIDQMEPGNLQFFIGREIGHIQAGHTWLRTLLKPLGSEVPVIGRMLNSVIFGDWVNRAEFTADRAGFLACRSLTTSISTMLKFGVGVSLFQKLDIREFLEQINDVRTVGGRVTEIISEQPYLTERVRHLVRFALSERFRVIVPEERAYTQILDALPQAFFSTGHLPPKAPKTTPLVALEIPTPQNEATLSEIIAADEVPNDPDDNAHDPRLRLVATGTNEPHILRRLKTRIGRNLDNDIVINNDRASRYHAEIILQGSHFLLVDKESRNGVWLNGQKITAPAEIKAGDHIRIGKQEFTFIRKD